MSGTDAKSVRQHFDTVAIEGTAMQWLAVGAALFPRRRAILSKPARMVPPSDGTSGTTDPAAAAAAAEG